MHMAIHAHNLEGEQFNTAGIVKVVAVSLTSRHKYGKPQMAVNTKIGLVKGLVRGHDDC